jgi:hypothetical protein
MALLWQSTIDGAIVHACCCCSKQGFLFGFSLCWCTAGVGVPLIALVCTFAQCLAPALTLHSFASDDICFAMLVFASTYCLEVSGVC